MGAEKQSQNLRNGNTFITSPTAMRVVQILRLRFTLFLRLHIP